MLACTAGLLACVPMQVRVDFDPEIDFTTLQNYAWLPRPEVQSQNPFADNPLLRKRVRAAVERNLEARGYREVEPEQADFRVTFHVTIETKTRAESWPSRYPHRYGSYHYEASFEQGTLILDILDEVGEQLYWRGWVQGAVPTPDTGHQRIDEAVRRILERFHVNSG